MNRETDSFLFVFWAGFNFIGNDLCILDNAITMDLVVLDFSMMEEPCLAVESVIVDLNIELGKDGVAETIESVAVEELEELEGIIVTRDLDLIAVDSNEELEDDEIAVTKEPVAIDELEDEIAVTTDLIPIDSNEEQATGIFDASICSF